MDRAPDFGKANSRDNMGKHIENSKQTHAPYTGVFFCQLSAGFQESAVLFSQHFSAFTHRAQHKAHAKGLRLCASLLRVGGHNVRSLLRSHVPPFLRRSLYPRPRLAGH